MQETDAPEMCRIGGQPRRSLWWLALALAPMGLALPGAASWAAREAPVLAAPLAAAAALMPDLASWGPASGLRAWWRGGR